MSAHRSLPSSVVLSPPRTASASPRPLPPSLRRARGVRPRRRQTLLRTALRALLARPAETSRDAERAVARIMAYVRRMG